MNNLTHYQFILKTMPKELIEDTNFNNAVTLYKKEIGSESYQSLFSLLSTLKSLLCKSSNLNVVSGVQQLELQ